MKLHNFAISKSVEWLGGVLMPEPLYLSKAEFFRTLGHPARIRVLELLGDGPLAVKDLLSAMDLESSGMSQQLAVLRRAGIVHKLPDGRYALAGPDVAELLATARRVLSQILASQSELLQELQGTGEMAPEPPVVRA